MTAAKKTATKSTAKAAPKAPKKTAKKTPTPEERYKKVEAEAYFLAEKDGFKKDPVDYWVAAEAKVGA